MVLTIEIAPQTETRLRQQAEAAGKDVRDFVSQLLDEAAARASLDQVLATVRQQFAESGISDAELLADITDAQAEYRAQRHTPIKKPA